MPGLPLAVSSVALVTSSQVLAFLPLVLILLANAAALPAARPGLPPWWYWGLLAVVGVATALLGLASAGSNAGYGVGLAAGGTAMASLALAPVRARVARFWPIERSSVLDATALGFTFVIAASQAGLQLGGNVLAQVASSTAVSPSDLVLNELPFLLAALLGVGIFMRRGPGAALTRLGLVRPRWWHVCLGLACAGGFYLFSLGADTVQQVLTPGTAARVGAATGKLYGGIGTPLGITTIALAAGICEETLFRGALQPRLGIVWTAIVFALVHTQYGISIDELAVLVLAFGLGGLRAATNTTTSMICHVAYNAITAAQLAASALAWPGLAAEALLLAAVGAGIGLSRRSPDRTTG
ncbi:MAG: CPBP family intramembrane glutamic endopeptidase [Candidatus Dormiibacterota bacterium]